MSELKIEIIDEAVLRKIYQLREKNIMIDSDLAELYGVSTTRLNEQVKRNISRFPEDFMFQITKVEKEWLIENGIGSSKLKFSPKPPFVFTDLGIAMLSSVLNSPRAIQVNIGIMRIFNKLRQMFNDNQELRMAIKLIEQNVNENSLNIRVLFDQLEELLKNKAEQNENRELIGFKKK